MHYVDFATGQLVEVKNKITALKWKELTDKEKELVIKVNNKASDPKPFVYLMEISTCYYFDRLGNIYTHQHIN